MIVRTHITFKDPGTPADLERAGLSKAALARLAKASFESIMKLADEPGCTYSIETEVAENDRSELKPCPLCGGEAVLEYLSQGDEHCKATIRCQSCGLTLDWDTEYMVGVQPNGSRVPLRVGLDPLEAWNRRAEVAHGES